MGTLDLFISICTVLVIAVMSEYSLALAAASSTAPGMACMELAGGKDAFVLSVLLCITGVYGSKLDDLHFYRLPA